MHTKSQSIISIVVFITVAMLVISCHNHSSGNASLQTIDSSRLRNKEDTVLINQGKLLFKQNCNTCHSVFKTDNYLEGIVDYLGADYLKLYLTKQDSLIRAKDTYALQIKKLYGNQFANAHNYTFSDAQLNAIIAFLKKYS
ncbi:MAG: c-type cytochrome [Agriterribacter sp.]